MIPAQATQGSTIYRKLTGHKIRNASGHRNPVPGTGDLQVPLRSLGGTVTWERRRMRSLFSRAFLTARRSRIIRSSSSQAIHLEVHEYVEKNGFISSFRSQPKVPAHGRPCSLMGAQVSKRVNSHRSIVSESVLS